MNYDSHHYSVFSVLLLLYPSLKGTFSSSVCC